MQVFGFSYECYVPDTQILFPHVFLDEIEKLPANDQLYRECVCSILENNIRLVLLPHNHAEFYNLALESFKDFLEDVRLTAIRNKVRGKQAFLRAASGQITAKIANNQYPSDFLTYWHSKESFFAGWLELDERTMRYREHILVLETIKKFNNISEYAEINIQIWENPELEKEAQETCGILRELRNQKLIPEKAHEQDLAIISDCIVYRNHYLETGILYLVTNDEHCFNTLKTITNVQNGKGAKFRVSGIDSVKPHSLLSKIKEVRTKKGSHQISSSG